MSSTETESLADITSERDANRAALKKIMDDYEGYDAVTARHLYLLAYRALYNAGVVKGPPVEPR